MHVSLRMAEGVCPYMSPLHDPLCPPTLLSVSLFVCPGILVALVLPRPPVLDSLGCLTCVGCCLTEAGAVALTHLSGARSAQPMCLPTQPGPARPGGRQGGSRPRARTAGFGPGMLTAILMARQGGPDSCAFS